MIGFTDSRGRAAILEDRTRQWPDLGERVLAALTAYVQARGHAPTVRELSRLTGCAPSSVNYHLNRLHDDGAIERVARTARGIRIVEGPED